MSDETVISQPLESEAGSELDPFGPHTELLELDQVGKVCSISGDFGWTGRGYSWTKKLAGSGSEAMYEAREGVSGDQRRVKMYSRHWLKLRILADEDKMNGRR